ncbi:MAG: hypothetical protein A2293_08005 [Elusimicrobia bacterium RIFOXYB2_FULL_49_7]|nr:MAG: hypothetical protein A2293_08005 [Elusimicrobia bacterium RIFOXYB2_FULL_49_7]
MNWNRTVYEGNTVAQYEYRTLTCHHCNGEGMIEISLHDLKMHIYTKAFGRDWRELLAIYREWKKNRGKIECPECHGRGRCEEWR